MKDNTVGLVKDNMVRPVQQNTVGPVQDNTEGMSGIYILHFPSFSGKRIKIRYQGQNLKKEG